VRTANRAVCRRANSGTQDGVPRMVISRNVKKVPATSDENDGVRKRNKSRSDSAERKQKVRTLYAMARAAERKSDSDTAEELLRKCIALDEQDGHSWLALAQILSKFDQEAARTTFEEGLLQCPCNVHLLQARGVFEHRNGNIDAAREAFREALALEPENPYVCQAWGLLEQRNGETEAARSIYRKCVDLRPQSEVCAAWAMLEIGDGNAERARELFALGMRYVKRGLRNKVAYLTSWANGEERLGDIAKARSLLSKAVYDLSNPDTMMALAKLEARAGQLNDALELMRGAASHREVLSAAVYNGWACLEMQANHLMRARQLLEEGHKQHPADAALLQTWGTLEEKQGNYDRARDLFHQSVEARPTAVALVAWACMEVRSGDVERARAIFAEALRVDPLHGAAYNAAANLEMKMGNIEQARVIFERGLNFDPSASVLVGYAQLEMKFGSRKDKARELFQRGVSQTRGDTSFIWHAWLTMELRERDPRSARKIAEEARRRYRRNSRILAASALAEAASAPGVPPNLEESRRFFRDAVLVDPLHAQAWQAWGVQEFRQGNDEIARSLFRRGVAQCPNHGSLWQAWGVLEVEHDNHQAAEELFRGGIEKCPHHVPLYQAWACLEVRRGQFHVARELLERALRSDPTHGPAWTAFGLLESRYGSLEKAREMFVAGLRHAPNHGPLYRTYGTVEERAGNFHRARQLFRAGIEHDPFDAPLYKALSLLEKKLGSRDAFKDLALQARDIFGAANVKSVLIDGRYCGWSSAQEDEDQVQLQDLWSMECALNMSSRSDA